MHGGMSSELWLSHADDVRPQVELQERIWDELHHEFAIETADVNVWVEDFVVTLSGSVPSYHARFDIEQAVERIAGVHALSNGLRVEVPQARQGRG